jgi:hypothetical protein
MLKNKLVEQILAERFYFIEAATTSSATQPPTQTATTSQTTTNGSSTEMLALAILSAIAGGGSLLSDLKKLISPPDPIKTDPDVFLSKIPSMISPETLRTPRLQRVKEFGSAEGKKIAS